MANKPLQSITFPGLSDVYEIPQQVVDDTLTQTGEAADAKITGDEITTVKSLLNDTDYGFPPYMLSMFKKSVNLFSDFCNPITNSYYGHSGSVLKIKSTPNYKGWLIRVNPNTTYTVGPVDYEIDFFKSNYALDKRSTNPSNSEPNTVTSGSNSYWMSITAQTSRDMSQWMAVEGDTYPDSYVSGIPQWIEDPIPASTSQTINIDDTLTQTGEAADAKKTGDEITTVKNLLIDTNYGFPPYMLSMFKKSINLFSDFCNPITNSYYGHNYVELRIKSTPNYKGWLIRVKPNTTYTVGPVDYEIDFFKSNYALDKRSTNLSNTEPNTVTSGSNSYWMSITARTSRDMSQWMAVEGDTYPDSYVSGIPQWIAKPLDPEEQQESKTIAFMGDSITAGVVAGKCYHEFIHDRYGYTCLNFGFGGAGYYKNSSSNSSGRIGFGTPGMGVATNSENFFTPNNVVARLPELSSLMLDGIVIFAGTNDWGNNVSIENYISGIEEAFEYCKTNYTTIPVLVMTPIHRANDTVPNGQGKTLREYADILIEECKKYAMPYVDTMTMSGYYADSQEVRNIFSPSNLDSGLHPGIEGHKRIANAIGETLKQVISVNFD